MPGPGDEELLHRRYRLEEAIGQGGFGTTWRAHDVALDIPVCIKEFFDTDSEVTQTVYGEARSLADFRDEPGIVRVWDAFMEDGRAYLVMELLEGEDLTAFVRERGALSVDYVVGLLGPVFHALDRVHEAGVIHRDVSPDNIRVLRDEDAPGGYTTKLMDFGATVLSVEDEHHREPSSSHTTVLVRPGQHAHVAMDDVVIVRAGYSSPEQYRSPHGLTPAADVYSLAATIWYCITGMNPRSDVNAAGELGIVPPSQVRPGCIDPEREAVLMAALDVDAGRRPQGAGELRERLLRRPEADVPDRPSPRVLPRRWVAVAAIAAAVVIALVVLVPRVRSAHTVPNVVGFTQDAAVERLQEHGVRLAGISASASEQAEGTVIGQDPDEGEAIPDDGVTLTVSSGRSDEMVSVPDVLGSSEDEARQSIEAAGLSVGSVTQGASDEYSASLVCQQDPPADETVAGGTVVNLVISRGEDQAATSSAPVRDALGDYSWEELGAIAEQISAAGNRSAALQLAARYHLVSDDGHMLDAEKSLDFAGSTIGLRVVDVYHDDLASGGKAGLTLLDVDAGLHGPVNVASSDGSNVDGQGWVTNVGGWRDSNIRARLQKLESSLPDGLLAAVKPVLKNTNNEGECDEDDPEAVSTTTDVLWLPSLVEVGGEVDWLKRGDDTSAFYNAMANDEGSQYAAFAQAGVMSAHNTASIGAISSGDAKCWLRSTSMETGRARCIRGLDPSYTASADEYDAYMLGFCL